MTSMTGLMKAAQLKGIEFELTWETRDDIISNLNRNTKVLSGLTIDSNYRYVMRHVNGDMVTKLMCLPLKVAGRLSESFVRLGGGPNEVVLDLDSETRLRIINTLLSNNQIAFEADSVSGECKSQQIDENNQLISKLLKLKSRALGISPVQPSYGLNASTQPSTSQQQPPTPEQQPPTPEQQPPTPEQQPPTFEQQPPTPEQQQSMPPPMSQQQQSSKPVGPTSTEKMNFYSHLSSVRNRLVIPSIDSSSWHQRVSQKLRTYLQRKMLAALQPAEPTTNQLIEIAKSAESHLYQVAKSREDYFHQIAKWSYRVQKNQKKKAMERQQPNTIRPAISKKEAKRLRRIRKKMDKARSGIRIAGTRSG